METNTFPKEVIAQKMTKKQTPSHSPSVDEVLKVVSEKTHHAVWNHFSPNDIINALNKK